MDKKKPLALIVEDNEDLSLIFAGVFSEAGFQTETIQDGRMALERLHQTTPQVVNLDMLLPGVSGMDILKYVRSENRLEMTSVIVTTADPVMAEQVHELADFVLIKPIGFVQLHKLAAQLYSALMG
jgi:DNA-binding response OmpR family regulator